MYKRLYVTGIAAWLLLLAMAMLFYKERILFLDASFVLFHIIREGTFCIQVYRFGDAIMQLLPVLSFKAGLPLKDLIMSFSVSPVLIGFGAYVICGSVLKEYRFALVILLTNILFAADTFYWPISQIPQGIAFLMLVLSLLNGKTVNEIRFTKWSLIAALLILLAFFHPLMSVIILFTLCFFWLSGNSVFDRKTLVYIAAIFFISLAVKLFFFNASYDRYSLSGLKNFVRLYPDYLHLYSNERLLHNCLTKYCWLPVIFIGIAVFYVRTAQWKKLVFIPAAVLGYILLINVTYPTAETPGFYIENLYLPVALFLALPLLFDVLPAIRIHRMALPVLLLIMVTGCARIYTTHTAYTARLQWERDFLKQNGDRKTVAPATMPGARVLQMTWGTCYEFLLLSVAEQGKPASIIIDDQPAKYEFATTEKKVLVVNWDRFPYTAVNNKYFHFTDTTTVYQVDTLTK
jgi:hypothetical protein